MKKCECCRSIYFLKKSSEEKDEKYNQSTKMFAKISCYTWLKGQRRMKGDQISSITTKAYDLKYCPSCGRKICVELE